MGILDFRRRTWRWEYKYKGMKGAYKLYCLNINCSNFNKGTPTTETVDGKMCISCGSRAYAKCKHCIFPYISWTKMSKHRHFKKYGYDSYETY